MFNDLPTVWPLVLTAFTGECFCRTMVAYGEGRSLGEDNSASLLLSAVLDAGLQTSARWASASARFLGHLATPLAALTLAMGLGAELFHHHLEARECVEIGVGSAFLGWVARLVPDLGASGQVRLSRQIR